MTDIQTQHTIRVSFKNNMYLGVVEMPEQEETLSLEPWPKGENPFQDDLLFKGSGFSPRGDWWFVIRPSVPFSQIMAEVEALNILGFHKHPTQIKTTTLSEITPKLTNSGHVFWNISDDLGNSCKKIMASTPEIQMAYGYARRTAAVAMYLQGLMPKEGYDHVQAVFKSLQWRTGQTVEFQKQAFLDSIDYMQTYNPLITSFFVKTITPMIHEYEGSANRMSDADFFKAVIDVAWATQEASRHQ